MTRAALAIQRAFPAPDLLYTTGRGAAVGRWGPGAGGQARAAPPLLHLSGGGGGSQHSSAYRRHPRRRNRHRLPVTTAFAAAALAAAAVGAAVQWAPSTAQGGRGPARGQGGQDRGETVVSQRNPGNKGVTKEQRGTRGVFPVARYRRYASLAPMMSTAFRGRARRGIAIDAVPSAPISRRGARRRQSRHSRRMLSQ